MDSEAIRLTDFSRGGGCGCKIAPSVLADILAALPSRLADPALMVGLETSDDAAVYRIDDHRAVVASLDFFPPIVDDPFDFGRIAAANALSDVYAMGARPVMALAVVGMPLDRLSGETIGRILAGGVAACEVAGVTIAGGHSIDAPEPAYGLAVIGLIDPGSVCRNDGARAGDVMILGKLLGIGILAAALRKGALDEEGYAEMLRITTRLNTVGIDLARIPGVHAMTDVTGFGLLGHLLEICRASGLAASLDFDRLPVIPAARKLAKRGISTGASERNWASYAEEVVLARDLADWERNILCDPQTSGGLLVCCGAGDAERVMGAFNDQGFAEAATIGAFAKGPALVTVR